MTNVENINYEVHDLLAVLEMLQEKSIMGVLYEEKIKDKKVKVQKYMNAVKIKEQ